MQQKQNKKIIGLSTPQPYALSPMPYALSVGHPHSSGSTDSLQPNGDVAFNNNEFVSALHDNSRGLQVAFGKKHVQYMINKYHSNHNCKLCMKFNPSHSFIGCSTNKKFEVIVPSHISIIICATSNYI